MKLDTIKVALVLMKRAPLKGEEATAVAIALQDLEGLYKAMTAPPETEDKDVNDA